MAAAIELSDFSLSLAAPDVGHGTQARSHTCWAKSPSRPSHPQASSCFNTFHSLGGNIRRSQQRKLGFTLNIINTFEACLHAMR